MREDTVQSHSLMQHNVVHAAHATLHVCTVLHTPTHPHNNSPHLLYATQCTHISTDTLMHAQTHLLYTLIHTHHTWTHNHTHWITSGSPHMHLSMFAIKVDNDITHMILMVRLLCSCIQFSILLLPQFWLLHLACCSSNNRSDLPSLSLLSR